MLARSLGHNTLNDAMLDNLGKHSRCVGCLYLNRLGDVDTKLLRAIIKESFRRSKA